MIVVLMTTVIIQSDSLHIRFIGNAAVELTDGHTTLVSDFPYQSGAFGYMTYQADAAPGPDAVAVVTHRHADHFDARLFNAGSWRLIGPREVTDQVSSTRVLGYGDGTRVGAFTVHAQVTPHGPEHFSYVIEWQDRRLYFTGDTEDPATLLATAGLDIVFITPWLLCDITRGGGRVPAPTVVVYHHTRAEGDRGCGATTVLSQGEEMAVAASR